MLRKKFTADLLKCCYGKDVGYIPSQLRQAKFSFKNTRHCWLDSLRWIVGLDKHAKEV